jgi:mono/diheme cytochrome c family protein
VLVAVEGAIMMIAVVLALGAGAAGFFLGRSTGGSSHTKTVTVGGSAAAPVGNAQGKQVFVSAGCGGCHTLSDAGSSGVVGPNLDEAKPPEALVVARVTNGKGVMRSFRGQLTEAQIRAVAAYVSAASGK